MHYIPNHSKRFIDIDNTDRHQTWNAVSDTTQQNIAQHNTIQISRQSWIQITSSHISQVFRKSGIKIDQLWQIEPP